MFGFGKKKTDSAASTQTIEKKETPAKKTPPPAEPRVAAADGLKIKVKERQACLAVLSVQVSEGRVNEAVEDAYRHIQNRAKIPGFRPGKAPLDIVKKNFAGTAREEALDKTLRRAVVEAIENEKLDAVATPTVDKIEYGENKPLRFELKVETAPEVVLKNYKGLALDKRVKAFSDADVDKELEKLREMNAKLAPAVAGTVIDEKHFVIVDYNATMDGKPWEGGDAKGQMIDMSAPQTIAGFTDGLKGGKTGETREFDVTFPADYPKKELAGKPLRFNVTIQDIKEKQLPALDDDFAKDVNFESLSALKETLRKKLEADFERGVRQALERQVSDQLVDLHPLDLPPSQVTERTEYLNQRLKQYLLRQGASEEDWKSNAEKMTGKNKLEAERQLRLSYLLNAIGRQEKIEITDADIDAFINTLVEREPAPQRAEAQKYLEQRREDLRAQLWEEKLYTRLIEWAAVKEVPADNQAA